MNETQTQQPAVAPAPYENNPFYVATNGLELLFKKAQTIGIILAVLSVISAIGSLPSTFGGDSSQSGSAAGSDAAAFPSIPAEAWVVIGGFVLLAIVVVLLLSLIVKGIADYTSAKIAHGQTVALSEAFGAVFENFWAYLWLNVIIFVKTLLWSLLFIIPGIIMSVRYSLAGVSFFEKGLRGDAAVQHSSGLVKGAWATTFASQSLFNVITFGILQMVLYPGTNAVLYGQLVSVGSQKPKAHILSLLTVWVFMSIIVIIFLSVGLLLAWAIANYANTRI